MPRPGSGDRGQSRALSSSWAALPALPCIERDSPATLRGDPEHRAVPDGSRCARFGSTLHRGVPDGCCSPRRLDSLVSCCLEMFQAHAESSARGCRPRLGSRCMWATPNPPWSRLEHRSVGSPARWSCNRNLAPTAPVRRDGPSDPCSGPRGDAIGRPRRPERITGAGPPLPPPRLVTARETDARRREPGQRTGTRDRRVTRSTERRRRRGAWRTSARSSRSARRTRTGRSRGKTAAGGVIRPGALITPGAAVRLRLSRRRWGRFRV